MKNKSLVTMTNLYFPDWNKCLTITKTALPLIKQEAIVMEVHQDSYSNKKFNISMEFSMQQR